MGIDAQLEDENGNAIEELGDPRNTFARILASQDTADTLCLRFINPFGDTTFNELQLPVLIGELQTLLGSIKNEDACRHLRGIVRLAERGLRDHHQYLKFRGD